MTTEPPMKINKQRITLRTPEELRFEIVFLLYMKTTKHRTKLEAETEKRPVYKQCYRARQVELHSAKAD